MSVGRFFVPCLQPVALSCREQEQKKRQKKSGRGALSFNMDEEEDEDGEDCKFVSQFI